MQQGVKLLQQSKTYSQGPECGQASQVLSFIQLVLLFGNGMFGTFPDFPVLWGSEIKPFSFTHLSQENGKGSEELEAVVVFLLSSWSWMQWGTCLCGAFRLLSGTAMCSRVPALSTSCPPFLEPHSSRAQSCSVLWALLPLDGCRRLPALLLGLI